mmetsp:Transcript_137541/g.293997  ORF Transcript_137541/g.293997 Transcript_137541/m.293997 type:complete len:222 (+) Transcript_137541:247-912(+)
MHFPEIGSSSFGMPSSERPTSFMPCCRYNCSTNASPGTPCIVTFSKPSRSKASKMPPRRAFPPPEMAASSFRSDRRLTIAMMSIALLPTLATRATACMIIVPFSPGLNTAQRKGGSSEVISKPTTESTFWAAYPSGRAWSARLFAASDLHRRMASLIIACAASPWARKKLFLPQPTSSNTTDEFPSQPATEPCHSQRTVWELKARPAGQCAMDHVCFSHKK